MHNHSYAPARTTNLRSNTGTDQQNNHSNFPRKMSGKALNSSHCSSFCATSGSASGSSIFSQNHATSFNSDHQENPSNDPGITKSNQQSQQHRNRRRPSSILPIGITFACNNNKSKQRTGATTTSTTSTSDANSSINQPKVVLTPTSPYDSKLLGSKTLYDPNGNEDSGLSMFGTASTLTATCVDIDMESLLSESSGSESGAAESVAESSNSSSSASSSRSSLEEPVCSVARAMWCQGNFRFLDGKGQSVASTAFTSMTVSSSASAMSNHTPTISAQPQIVLRNEATTCVKSEPPGSCNMVSSYPRPPTCDLSNVFNDEGISLERNTRHQPLKAFKEAMQQPQTMPGTSSLLLQQNPYRRIFEQRQQFYEKLDQMTNSSACTEASTCSIKGGWQRCQGGSSGGIKSRDHVFTVRTNIEPFGPFVIEHDVKSQGPGKLSHGNMICLNPESESELRYATSHSGEGVESHLEVSLGKDGSIIKTRHQRLDQNSTENSILKLQYGEGGKVLEIQQTQSVTAVPIRDKAHLSTPAATTGQGGRIFNNHRPTSAYCTSGPATMNNLQQQFLVPRYNSMPNLDRSRSGRLTSSELGFNIHPADEEKRMAYTRGTFFLKSVIVMRFDKIFPNPLFF